MPKLILINGHLVPVTWDDWSFIEMYRMWGMDIPEEE